MTKLEDAKKELDALKTEIKELEDKLIEKRALLKTKQIALQDLVLPSLKEQAELYGFIVIPKQTAGKKGRPRKDTTE